MPQLHLLPVLPLRVQGVQVRGVQRDESIQGKLNVILLSLFLRGLKHVFSLPVMW